MDFIDYPFPTPDSLNIKAFLYINMSGLTNTHFKLKHIYTASFRRHDYVRFPFSPKLCL